MEAGGIMYTPLDPTVEGRNRITSMDRIDSITGTCMTDKPKSVQRNVCVVINPTAEDQRRNGLTAIMISGG